MCVTFLRDMKKLGVRGGGGPPRAPPLDPPLVMSLC